MSKLQEMQDYLSKINGIESLLIKYLGIKIKAVSSPGESVGFVEGIYKGKVYSSIPVKKEGFNCSVRVRQKLDTVVYHILRDQLHNCNLMTDTSWPDITIEHLDQVNS